MTRISLVDRKKQEDKNIKLSSHILAYETGIKDTFSLIKNLKRIQNCNDNTITKNKLEEIIQTNIKDMKYLIGLYKKFLIKHNKNDMLGNVTKFELNLKEVKR